MKSDHIAIVSALAAGLALNSAGCSQPAAADPKATVEAKTQKPVAIKTVAVVQQDVRQTSVQPATVHPFYTAEIQAKVRGYVSEVNADIGDVVKAGSVLAVIDVPETGKQRLMALAMVERQKAEEHRARANIELAKANVQAFEALEAEAKSKLQQVKEREVEQIDELIKFATLTAPFDGVVTVRNVSPGNLVSERSIDRPLFVISQLDRMRIHIPVPEDDAALVQQGDSITVSFPSFPADEAMEVSVTRLTGSLDPNTRMMLVEAEVANTDGKLLPGMFGKAEITLGTKLAATVLPARTVRFREDGEACVYVVTDGKITVVPVTTGADDGNTIEIAAGVKAGQIVVDNHLQRFTDGQVVRVVK